MVDRRRMQNSREDRRAGRASHAAQHIADSAKLFSAEIERSLQGLQKIDKNPAPKTGGEFVVPSVEVRACDSVAAILEEGRGVASRCDLAVLDFASYTSPAGGYDRGFWGQEQALCDESYLANVLLEQKSWYQENRQRNLNCELYRNRALVVPAVRFERDNYHSYADVIVCAAPNARRASANYHIDAATQRAAMQDRIRFVLAVADSLGHDKLILGAYGCGAFGWDAATIAELFRAELAGGTHRISQVIFAVPKTRYDEHYDIFEHAFAKFPEQNTDAYIGREEREAVKASEKAPAQDDSDDEEEDWRKYLLLLLPKKWSRGLRHKSYPNPGLLYGGPLLGQTLQSRKLDVSQT